MRKQLENGLLRATEALFATIPRKNPTATQRNACHIVSHRGVRDGINVHENTLAAFDAAAAAGVWGIEFDIRWTRDLQPVVHHDADMQRVFGLPRRIADLTLAELRNLQPLIPTLAEMIDRYGGRLHLMIEIKAEPYPDAAAQQTRLLELMRPLTPVADYHFMALEVDSFEHVRGLPPACWLPIATTNVAVMSTFAIANDCGGLTGHYLLLGKRLRQRHTDAGQAIGVGYPAHHNVLLREVNRGTRWVFSNQAARLQSMLDQVAAG